jgi:hypothetical protein
VSEEEQTEYRIFVGPPIPIEQYAAWLAEQQKLRASDADGEVEFVSPREGD